ncbi:17536_t:CDS:2 [Entrophospora sp. SA101]|nr:17536_t:CDS:2 [Entrophospora sp. SA101]
MPTTMNNFFRSSKSNKRSSTNTSRSSNSQGSVPSSSPPQPIPIKLNVGGNLYITTQQTLCIHPSYLSELFFLYRSPESLSSSPQPKKRSKELFIDRDGTHFDHILNFLRTGTLPKISLSILQKLECEAKFYGIKPLINLVSQRIQNHLSLPKFKVVPIQSLSQENNNILRPNPKISIYNSSNNSINNIDVNYEGKGDDDDDIFNMVNENINEFGSGVGSRLSSNQSFYTHHNLSLSNPSYGEVPIIYNPKFNESDLLHPYSSKNISTRSLYSNNSNNNNDNNRESCVRTPQSEPKLIGDKVNSTDYDIISITSVPIFFKKCPEGHGELNRFSDPYCDTTCTESHVQLSKEMATYVVLKRKDD